MTKRLLRIAPYNGLALLLMLVERGLITETLNKDLRREQTCRHFASETTKRLYEIAFDAPICQKQHCFYTTVNEFLGADKDTLWARARSAEWPAFE